MIGNLFRVTTKELEEILSDSSILESKVYSQDSSSANDLLDIDKSWEAIFYLLTGYPVAEIENVSTTLSWTLFSGQVVDEEQNMGYGPAQYITSEQVKELNIELEKFTREDLQRKYDGKKMNEAGVYPQVWDETESLEYALDNFELLKKFYRTAEKENKAVITFIN
jgi:Domain of unknown function (DUF1877)